MLALPLSQDSQALLSFMTTNIVIKPTRSTQGVKNTGPNFQAKNEPLFHEICEQLKAWLDDLSYLPDPK